MKQIKFSRKLEPLFRPKTRYTVLIGGRGGGKSFGVAAATALTTYDDSYNIMYLRYTMISAEVSIIPEFMEKISLLNSDADFITRRHDVVNRGTGARIFFRGMKTGSKLQTAALKSLHKVKWAVFDEAEEIPSETEFDTIDDSLREKDTEIRVILVLNQADVNHWIYRKFYKENSVPDDFCGIKGDVTYIPITYLDNRHNLHPSFLEKAEAMRLRNPERWRHVYGTEWLRNRKGLIYPNWKAIKPEDYPVTLPQWYGLDWGYSGDPAAIIRMCYDPLTATLYLWLVAYRTGMLARDIARAITEDASTLLHHYERVQDYDTLTWHEEPVYYQPADCIVYGDPARPEGIGELRRIYGINAIGADNRDKTGRIGYLQGFNVCYVGDEIGEEQSAYSWKPQPHDPDTFTDIPQDGNDHAMDAINYGAVTHLRRLGASNQEGER